MLIIANFKQNLDLVEIKKYFESFVSLYSEINNQKHQIVFCPSYPYFELVKKYIAGFPNLFLGAQNVAKTEGGAYTGEISSKQLKDYCSYCIVGHSERRTNFLEGYEDINIKIDTLKRAGIIPIVCLRNLDDFKNVQLYNNCLIAYEPVEKIGGVEAESVENITLFYNSMNSAGLKIIYGGSVNSSNVLSLQDLNFLEGFLVGSASLQPASFIDIINKIN